MTARNFSWILVGNAALAASQWGIVVVLARFTPPGILGAYALGLSVAGVAFGLSNLELRTLQVTDHAGQTPFATYFQLRLATGLACLGVLAGLAVFLPYSAAAGLAIVAVGLGKYLDGISDVIYGRLQVLDLMTPIGKSQLAKAALSLILLGFTLRIAPNPLWAIGVTVAPYAAVLLLYDLPNLRRFGGVRVPAQWAASWAASRMGSLARMGIPLTLVSTLLLLNGAIPRLVAARYAGEAGAGVLAALGYLAVAPNLLLVALGQAGIAGQARSLAAGDLRGFLFSVSRMAGVAASIGALVLLAGYFFGGTILSTFYGARFLGRERELMIILGSGATGYLNAAVGYSLSSARVFTSQVPMMAAVCLVCLAACLWLAPGWGLAGAAAGQLAALLVQLAWSSLLLGRTVASRFASAPLSPVRIECNKQLTSCP